MLLRERLSITLAAERPRSVETVGKECRNAVGGSQLELEKAEVLADEETGDEKKSNSLVAASFGDGH